MKVLIGIIGVLEVLLMYLCRDTLIQYLLHLLGMVLGVILVLAISVIRDWFGNYK